MSNQPENKQRPSRPTMLGVDWTGSLFEMLNTEQAKSGLRFADSEPSQTLHRIKPATGNERKRMPVGQLAPMATSEPKIPLSPEV